MLPDQGRYRVLLPAEPDRPSRHEAAQAVRRGSEILKDSENAAVFTLTHSRTTWPSLVIAVADAPAASEQDLMLGATAVAAFEHALRLHASELPLGMPSWQQHVAIAIEQAFAQADATIRQRRRQFRRETEVGVSLSAAMVVGDWLAVAHVGDCGAYRLRKRQLEQLTEDRGRPRYGITAVQPRHGEALGLAASTHPSIGFFWLARGDIILIGNPRLHEQHTTAELVRLLGARQPIAALAQQLVAQTDARTTPDGAVAAVLRVSSLLGMQLPRVLPRGTALPSARAAPTRMSMLTLHRRELMIGSVLLLTGASALWLPRTVTKTEMPARVSPLQAVTPPMIPPTADPVVIDRLDTPPPAVLVAEIAVINPEEREADEMQAQAAREERGRDQRAAARAARARADSLQRALAADAPRDHSLAASTAALALQARRDDSARAALDAASSAAAASLAALRADSIAAAEALVRSATASAAAARLATARRAGGTRVLQAWLNGLSVEVNRRPASTPMLAAGPAAFAAFVQKRHPDLEQASLRSSSVEDSIGTATATWLLRWRGDFGTTTSRRVEATADIVPRGDGWTVSAWRITAGAP